MIKAEVNAIVVQVAGVPQQQRLMVGLSYDPDSDPLALRMTFHEVDGDVTWECSRELMMNGVLSFTYVGWGDVKIRKAGAYWPLMDAVRVRLESDAWLAEVVLDRQAVIGFLNRTQDAVKLGEENVDGAVDDFLKEVLNP